MKFRNTNRARQEGVTIMSIMIAVAVAAVVAIAYFSGLLGQVNNGKIAGAEDNLTDRFPTVIQTYVNQAGYPDGSNKDVTDALVRYHAKPTTPWGQNWSAKFSGTGQTGNVVLTYPIGNDATDDNSDHASDIADKLDNTTSYPFIKSISADGATLTITYKFQ